jgi:ABC-type uncharacterized transport system permease subunit
LAASRRPPAALPSSAYCRLSSAHPDGGCRHGRRWLWIGFAGFLRHYRGVNETISSLLLAYIAIALMNQFVEGPLRDPASLNKPSTTPLPAEYMLGKIPGMDVHWGLAIGIVACIISWVLIEVTSYGFAARIAGGNVRAAQIQGLPVGRLIVGFTAIAGSFAGLAGMIEVAAVQGSANASLAAGYGYTGILVAFLARHNPLAIIPVAILLGGIDASGGLIQRRMGLPDATVLVLQGTLFVVILFCETFYGRFKIFNPDLWKRPGLSKGKHDGRHRHRHLGRSPGYFRGRHPRLHPVHLRQPRRDDHRALRPHQSRARGHAGVRRHDRLCGRRDERLGVARRAGGDGHRRRASD